MSRAELRFALDALDVLMCEPLARVAADRAGALLQRAAPTLRRLLAESVAEPVAWMDAEGNVCKAPLPPHWCPPYTPLYACPPDLMGRIELLQAELLLVHGERRSAQRAAEQARDARNRAVLTAPQGWRLVPEEPTEEMIVAARSQHEGEAYLPVGLWRAMLAAAPRLLTGGRDAA